MAGTTDICRQLIARDVLAVNISVSMSGDMLTIDSNDYVYYEIEERRCDDEINRRTHKSMKV